MSGHPTSPSPRLRAGLGRSRAGDRLTVLIKPEQAGGHPLSWTGAGHAMAGQQAQDLHRLRQLDQELRIPLKVVDAGRIASGKATIASTLAQYEIVTNSVSPSRSSRNV